MTDFHLWIPPVSQITFPYIAAPILKAVLELHGFSVVQGDVNMAYFEHFRQKAGTIFPENDFSAWNNFYLDSDPLQIDDDFSISWISAHLDYNALAVGFSIARSSAYAWALQGAVIIKKICPNVNVLLGGAFFDGDIARQTLSYCAAVDAVAVGESDVTIVEYLEALRGRDVIAAEHVDGLVVRNAAGVAVLNARKLVRDKTMMSPFADFSDLPVNEYLNFRLGTRILPILGSRGCVGRCAFCAEERMWGGFRSRTPEAIVGEMECQIGRYRATVFRFNDSLLNAETNHMEALCDLLIKRQLGVEWAGNVRLHRNLSPPLLEKMRSAGCRQLWFGLESASPRMLNLMHKDVDLEIAAQVLHNTKQAGILVLVFLISDFPGEKYLDTKATLEFLEKNSANIDSINVSEYKLLKNSAMYEEAGKFGIAVEGKDEFGIPMWATTSHTIHNRALIDRVSKRFWSHPPVPWPLVGGF
jgi:radical SAM superfamily enzyme YgiQ (UPF0313 family)